MIVLEQHRKLRMRASSPFDLLIDRPCDVQVEFLSAKTLAQDMYIDDLETSLSEAARSMSESGLIETLPKEFLRWTDDRSNESRYNRYHRTHVEVSADCISKSGGCMTQQKWRARRGQCRMTVFDLLMPRNRRGISCLPSHTGACMLLSQ
jgi:hypothetical protein